MDQDPNTSDPAAPKRSRLPMWVVVLSFGALTVFLAMMALGMNRAREGPITTGNLVPEFELTTFEGQTISTADYAGKVIVVNFWASWCKPCEQEAAELEEAWKQYEDGGEVIFLGLNYVDTETAAREYLERFAITYPNGPDLRTKVSQMFRIAGVPETYIIDQEGRLSFVKKGPFLSIGEITTAIDSLLE